MSSRQYLQKIVCCCVALVIFTTARVTTSAQSLDANVATPIRANNLFGIIAARDLGDARLTQHYYAFRGNPGDVLITVNSRNLNGDIDIFTATTLRPLLKLTLYAESTTPVTKGIYLRRSEDLILRVEARTPNDDEGTYQVFFGGSFQPIEGGPEIAENETPDTPKPEVPASDRPTKRVSSVGARIDEPPPPVAEVAVATPSPEPTPEPTPEAIPEARPVESPTPSVTEKPAEVEAPRTTRSTRGRRPSSRRNTTPAARPRPAPTEEAKTEQPTEPAAELETKSEASGTGRRGSTPDRAAQSEPEPEVGPRLIIETNDGTLINRAMSGVRRVTVENGRVVVVGKDGKIDRILLVNVVRMTIQP